MFNEKGSQNECAYRMGKGKERSRKIGYGGIPRKRDGEDEELLAVAVTAVSKT